MIYNNTRCEFSVPQLQKRTHFGVANSHILGPRFGWWPQCKILCQDHFAQPVKIMVFCKAVEMKNKNISFGLFNGQTLR